MRKLARLLPLLALAALAACGRDSPVAPPADLSFHNVGRHGDFAVEVMTRNMYIGADVDVVMQALITEDQSDDLPALGAALATLQHTDFATRVRAIAGEIARTRPDVVGLQEVYELSVIPAYLGLPGDPIQIDFLPALQRALARERVDYVVAAKNTSTDATLAGGAVHIVDHDVLLVNPHRVKLTGPAVAAVYQANIGEVVPGLTLLRGYVARPAKIDGLPLLLVNTHLESGESAQLSGLRYYQALELAGFIGSAPKVILTGDFNDLAGSLMYGVLAGAGLVDTWAALRPNDPGFSCCQAADLSNPVSILDQRIDFIWTRGFARPSGRLDGEIRLISANPSARVHGAFGLIWPSDHAGVLAELEAPQPFVRH
jgi:endonuclease/exonuclease/phosphatase family metal-dependent hydrolase